MINCAVPLLTKAVFKGWDAIKIEPSVWSKLRAASKTPHPVTFHTLAHCLLLMYSSKWWNRLLWTPQILRNIGKRATDKWATDMLMPSLHFWEAATIFCCGLLSSVKWFSTFLYFSNPFFFLHEKPAGAEWPWKTTANSVCAVLDLSIGHILTYNTTTPVSGP